MIDLNLDNKKVEKKITKKTEEKKTEKKTEKKKNEKKVEDKKKIEKKSTKSGRVFNIMQYCKHPVTGEILIDESKILEALSHKIVTQYCYILHDKDTYTDDDQDKDTTGKIKSGELKPPHYHIVLKTAYNQISVETIAKWFDIKSNFIDVPKGRGAFEDCAEYLTHENFKQYEILEKYVYPREAVKANFLYDHFMERRKMRHEGRGYEAGKTDPQIMEAIRMGVMYNGLTLLQARLKDEFNYLYDYKELSRLRLEYINREAPLPVGRLNFYVTGKGGAGKGLLSRALARHLYVTFYNVFSKTDKQLNIDEVKDDEIFFIVGNENSTFEGYDGQPIIIWDDKRSGDLLKLLGGRDNVFNVFDPFPVRQRQNVKYSSINLCNMFNIVNSIQPYNDFLDGLAGEYKDRKTGVQYCSEDKGQAYRRFPIIIPIYENDFDIMLNKGYFNNTKQYKEYEFYGRVRGNFQKIRERLSDNRLIELESKMVKPVVDKSKEVIDKLNEVKDITEEEYANEFGDYGTISYDKN